MGKLAERLADSLRSGVYRIETTEALDEAAAMLGFPVRRVALHGTTAEGLSPANVAAATVASEPRWDAYASALASPAGSTAGGHVVVFGLERLARHEAPALAPLIAALQRAAARCRLDGRRFFAVFLDPGKTMAMDPLYDRRRNPDVAATAAGATNEGGEA